MSKSSELSNLIIKRGVVKSQLTRFDTYLSKFKISNVTELETRLKKCEALFDEFDTIQSLIDISVPGDEFDKQLEERATFENNYYNIVGRAKDVIIASKASQTQVSLNASNVGAGLNHSNVKLPTIDLPVFSGNYEQWLNFYDTFNSLIHNNRNLSNIEKYYYLRAALKGESSQIIASLEATNENYEEAWSLLRGRYENKKLLIHNHVKALFDLESSSKETHISLRKLLDDLNKNLRALKSLKQPTDSWSTLVIHLICTKLSEATRREWESSNQEDSPTLKDFTTFLERRCQLLEKIDTGKVKQQTKVQASGQGSYSKHTDKQSNYQSHSFVSTNQSCPVCQQGHQIYWCDKFKALTPKEKYTEAIKLKLCTNCLRTGHFKDACISSACRKCNKPHNTLLHDNSFHTRVSNSGEQSKTKANDTQTQDKQETNTKANETVTSINTHTMRQCESQVILSTAIVEIYDKKGNIHEARALLDSGSQSNFMTQQMCDKLQLAQAKVNIPVGGINKASTNIQATTKAKIKSKINSFKRSLSFLILNNITENLPLVPIDDSVFKIPDDITLADPNFSIPSKIDLLLGASVFWDLLCQGQIRLSNNSPVIQKTQLGWIISGLIMQPTCKTICNFSNIQLHEQIEKFWKTEECTSNQKYYSTEEKRCEEHFQATCKRQEDGRFEVSLPFKHDKDDLGDTKKIALKRLHAMERKFENNRER